MFLRSAIVISMLLSSTFILQAQTQRIASFSVQQSAGNAVVVNWAVPSGETCRNVEVQRSELKTDFQTVYRYPGVCGNSDVEEQYSWVDVLDLPSIKLYYRIKLSEAEFSEIDSVFFQNVKDKKTILISPNPISEQMTIFFNQSLQGEAEINIYDTSGKRVWYGKKAIESSLRIDLSNLKSGNHIIKVKFDDGSETEEHFVLVNGL